MKALTLWQPWASLVALGVKTIETRSWSTNYRGPLAIHAGKATKPNRNQTMADSRLLNDAINAGAPELPLGAVIATCTLVDVVRIVSWVPLDGPPVWAAHMIPQPWADPEESPRLILVRGEEAAAEVLRDNGPMPDELDATPQIPYGDFTPGRFAWLLDDIEQIDVVPARGRQQLWEWDR